jgi:hypothetical protein
MSSVQTATGPGTALPTFLPWSSNIKPPTHQIIPFIKTSTNKSSSGSQHSCVFPPPIKQVHNFHITLSLLSIVAPSAISVIKGFKAQSSPARFLKFWDLGLRV